MSWNHFPIYKRHIKVCGKILPFGITNKAEKSSTTKPIWKTTCACSIVQRQMWEAALEKQILAITLLTRHFFPKKILVGHWATLANLLCATGRNV
jgi:hypothetical protein